MIKDIAGLILLAATMFGTVALSFLIFTITGL